MKPKFDMLGSVFGVLGAAVCILAVILRQLGRTEAGDWDPSFMTMHPFHLFVGGLAIMVFGCWCKLCAK